jgi:hypothetical protein
MPLHILGALGAAIESVDKPLPPDDPRDEDIICTESCVNHGGTMACLCDKDGVFTPGC